MSRFFVDMRLLVMSFDGMMQEISTECFERLTGAHHEGQGIA